MALFKTDLEALFYISLVIVGLYFINKIVSDIFEKSTKIPMKQKIMGNFLLKIISVLVIIFLIIEGLPAVSQIDPTYTAVLTGAISTAIAFASSGIFANLIAGIVLMLIRPFDVGDLIKIEGDKGIVRTIGLTKILIETFDNLFIEKSNAQIISSKIVNYTLKLGKKKSFEHFKKKFLAPQDKGLLELNDEFADIEDLETELKKVYDLFSSKYYPNLYNLTFRMDFPYKGFRNIMEKVDNICLSYREKEIFRIKPKYDIVNFGLRITVKFRILTFNPEKLFDYQPKLAQEIFEVINQ